MKKESIKLLNTYPIQKSITQAIVPPFPNHKSSALRLAKNWPMTLAHRRKKKII
jgi:hypothetical protein